MKQTTHPIIYLIIPEKSRVSIKLLNTAGQIIEESERMFEKGFYKIPVNLKKSGIYFINLKTKGGEKKGKFIFVK